MDHDYSFVGNHRLQFLCADQKICVIIHSVRKRYATPLYMLDSAKKRVDFLVRLG